MKIITLLVLIILGFVSSINITYGLPEDYLDCTANVIMSDCKEAGFVATGCKRHKDIGKTICDKVYNLSQEIIRSILLNNLEDKPGTVYEAHPLIVCADDLILYRRGEIYRWKGLSVSCQGDKYYIDIEGDQNTLFIGDNNSFKIFYAENNIIINLIISIIGGLLSYLFIFPKTTRKNRIIFSLIFFVVLLIFFLFLWFFFNIK